MCGSSPRFATGTTDVVAGYSVALRTPQGVRPDWDGGGRLARDLTLPRLRAEWPDTPQDASAAVAEWKAAGSQRHSVSPGRESTDVAPELWEQCEAEVRMLRSCPFMVAQAMTLGPGGDGFDLEQAGGTRPGATDLGGHVEARAARAAA